MTARELSAEACASTCAMTTQTETAFAALLDEIAGTHRRMVQQLADDETTLLEAHKWILSILQVAAEVQLWADTARPALSKLLGHI